jgi:hypothetical protein
MLQCIWNDVESYFAHPKEHPNHKGDDKNNKKKYLQPLEEIVFGCTRYETHISSSILSFFRPT